MFRISPEVFARRLPLLAVLLLGTGLGLNFNGSADPATDRSPLAATTLAKEAAFDAEGKAKALLGPWVVDLRPGPEAPAYLKNLTFTAFEKGELRGRFYDADFLGGRVNTAWDAVHFAFETQDGSGHYSTQGVLRGDRIEGRTFAAHRDSLWVWTARRDDEAGKRAAADHAAVRRAAADYVEAIYQAKPELLERGVHPGLFKAGYRIREDGKGYQPRSMYTYEELGRLVRTFNAKGQYKDLDYELEVLDVLDQTASVRLKAIWGYDYMLLAREPDGRWRTRQILWQSPMPKR